jgi:hypothetical protein
VGERRGHATTYLVLGALVALIGILGAVVLGPKIAGDFQGPRPISAEELLEVKEADTFPALVAYTPDQPMVEANMGIETKGEGTNTKTRFVLVPVKDKWMVAEREMGATGEHLEGRLVTWEGLGREALMRIRAQHPDKRDKLLPVQLVPTRGDPGGAAVFLGTLIAALILLGSGGAVYGTFGLVRARG